MMKIKIDLTWDNEACVWTATSEDLMGLVMESGSLDALIERVRHAAPEILQLNGGIGETVSMYFRSERFEEVSING